jgi:predicted alpha/beta-fold hydrolase
MHFRGCSGRSNRKPHSYHSGETGDARFVIEWLRTRFPQSALSAVGYSLGGNMLLKLQAEYADDSPLQAVVSICAPIRLDMCANRMNQGFSRIYQRYLIRHLNRNLKLKAEQFEDGNIPGIDIDGLWRLRNFWQFDDQVTAPLNGFKDVNDYYTRSSARQYLKQIQKPTLMIHALDDPFMPADVVPDESELSTAVQLEISQHGGHVGFVAGSFYKPVYWLEQRIPEYIDEYL